MSDSTRQTSRKRKRQTSPAHYKQEPKFDKLSDELLLMIGEQVRGFSFPSFLGMIIFLDTAEVCGGDDFIFNGGKVSNVRVDSV